jgi:hypothetical protein
VDVNVYVHAAVDVDVHVEVDGVFGMKRTVKQKSEYVHVHVYVHNYVHK